MTFQERLDHLITTKDEFLVASTPIERVKKLEKWWGSELSLIHISEPTRH